MRFILAALAVVAVLTVAFADPAGAAQRALVIGNGAYQTLEPLDSAKNDAQRLSQILEKQGFTVALATNATNGGMRAAIQTFASGLGDGDTAVIYFTGHAFQARGRTYLLPITANLRSAIDLTTQGVALNVLLAVLERHQLRAGLLIVDAAFASASAAIDSTKPGLAAIEPKVPNLVVFYAARPNQVHAIRPGPSSVFGRALLTQMAQGNVVISDLVAGVTAAVGRATGGAQQPWSRTTLPDGTPLNEPARVRNEAAEAGTKAAAPVATPAAPLSEQAPTTEPLATQATRGEAYSLQDLISLDRTFSREERAAVQRRLQDMGYYTDAVDGVFGTQTRQAIRAYQGAQGAQRTGFLTPEQFNDLQ